MMNIYTRTAFLFLVLISLFLPTSLLAQEKMSVNENNKYLLHEQNGSFYVTCVASYPERHDKSLFCAALLWVVDNICSTQFLEVRSKDFSSKEVSFPIEFPSLTKEKMNYYANMTFRVDQSHFIVTMSDLKAKPNNLFASMPVKLEKYRNIEKQKNKEILDDFVESESLLLNSIIDFINNKHVNTEFWDAISIGKLEKGMNEDECKCAVGKPSNIHVNGDEVQWIVGMSTYLFFNNGVLTNIIK